METGTISEWKKKAGDKFVPGDVICSVETDKATVDFEAQEEGYIAKILVQAKSGEVKVGEPIMVTVDDQASVGAFANFTVGGAAAAPAAPAKPQAAAAPTLQTPPPAKPESKPAARAPSERVFASPLAKKLAVETGVELNAVGGTGPNGRVIAADVREAAAGAITAKPAQARVQEPVAAPAAAPAAAPKAPAPAPAPQQPVHIGGVYEDFVLDDVSRQLATRLAVTKQTVPHYHLSVDLNLDNLLKVRERLNKGAAAEEHISVQDMLVKAAALAMRQVPDVNASWMESFVRQYQQVDINIITGAGSDVTLPVLRDVGSIGLKQLAQHRRRLESAAFEGKLDAESVKLGTFSIVNLGMFGVKSAATIVVAPQACALALGAAEVRVVPRENPAAGEEPYQFSTMMTVTLACDHRVVDGAVGAQWMSAYKVLVEDPISMLM